MHQPIKCLAPIESDDSQILILGSMPSITSIGLQQYYAHPQNQFWLIIEKIFGNDINLNYSIRVRKIKQKKIAIWDVLATCIRPSSADSKISNGIHNDLKGFLNIHPGIHKICLNGTTAAKYFYQYQAKQRLNNSPINQDIQIYSLPSTSSANARVSLNDKLEAWRSVIKG